MGGHRFIIAGMVLLVAVALPARPGTAQVLEERLSFSFETRDEGSTVETPHPLHAAYNFELYGGTAVGTLKLELENSVDRDVTASFVARLESRSTIGQLELESHGRSRTLRVTQPPGEEPDEKNRHAKTRATSARTTKPAKPEAQVVVSEPFELSVDRNTALRATMRTSLPIEGRMFRLTLPSLHQTGTDPSSEPLQIRIHVVVRHPEPLLEVRSSSHQILVDFVGDRTIVETVETSVPADRPFELEFAVNDDERPTLAGYVRSQEDGRLQLETLVKPPVAPREESIRPKQVLFIVDSSGSMKQQQKLEQARDAVISSIRKMGPRDQFNVADFDSGFRLMQPSPVGQDSFGVDKVEKWLATLVAEGGTQLLPALEATLEQPVDPKRHRMIIVVTDGVLEDEKEALALLRRKLGDGRLFVVGTGPGMRQETLLSLAEYGRGAAAFAGRPEGLEGAVDELFDQIAQPLGWDLELDLAGLDVEEITPSRLPDLYAGQQVRVVAWVRGDLPSKLRLRMSTMNGERYYDVLLPPTDALLTHSSP